MKRKLKDLPKDRPGNDALEKISKENPTLECLFHKIAKLEKELETKKTLSGIFDDLLPELKDDCFNFQVNYKPFCDDLSPQEYASYGYEQGQKALITKLIDKGLL